MGFRYRALRVDSIFFRARGSLLVTYPVDAGPAGRQEVASTVRSRLTNKRIAVMRRGGPAHRALDFVAGEYRSSGPPFVLTLHLDPQPHGWGYFLSPLRGS